MESPAPPTQPVNSSSANSQNAPSSSTGPQIRSRITVVCAECKRLKLKCDRRAPCGSCTKRDTVVRCIYSPAAAEKVDLHSLNNRLIQVEAILQMITNGQQPPAFQPVYPVTGSYPSGTNLGTNIASNAASNNAPSFSTNSTSVSQQPSSQHQHHHHYAAPPSTANDSRLMLSPQDVSTIWLEDLDLGISRIPSTATTDASNTSTQQLHTHHPHTTLTSSNTSNLGYIKLEPSTIDVDFSYPQSSDSNANINNSHAFGPPIVIDIESNASPRIASRSSTPSLTRRANANHIPQYQQPQNHARAGPSGSGSASPFYSSSVTVAQAQLLLPALSIYYPIPSISPPGSSPSSSAAFPFQQPTHTSPTNYFTSSTSSAACISPISNHAANSAMTSSTSNSAASVNGYVFPPANAQFQNSSITLTNPHSNPPPAHNSTQSSQAPSSKPQVTPALLALLPPLERCKTLLERAGEVLKVRPVPLPLPISSDLDLEGVEDGPDANMGMNIDTHRIGMDEAGVWDWGDTGRSGQDEWNGNEDGDDGTSEGGSMAGRRKGKHRENGRQTRRGATTNQGRVHPPTKTNLTSWKAFETRCIHLLGGSSSGPAHLARLKRRQERERERGKERARERKEREKKEKAKEARRARQIYFGGIGLQASANSVSSSHASQLQDAEMEDGISNTGRGVVNRDKDAPGLPSSSLFHEDPSTNSGYTSEESGSGDEQSLTFFATMCAVLAIGALSSSSSSTPLSPRSTSIFGVNSSPTNPITTDSAAFFYALSQQALNVWETHLSSPSPSGINTGTENNSEVPDSDKERSDETERERMQYVLACIVGVDYLQLQSSITASGRGKGKEDARAEDGSAIHALLGKTVKVARSIGLDREVFTTSTFNPEMRTGTNDARSSISLGHNFNEAIVGKRRREKDGAEVERIQAKELEERERQEKEHAKEEWRRLLLCEVSFLDLFTSDALGLQPHITSPPNASLKLAPHSLINPEYSSDASSVAATSGHNDHNDGEHEEIYDSNSRRPFHSQNQKVSDFETADTENSYLDARYRLAQIAQSIKTRVTNPGCCCGYTFDQATSLQDDIRRWQSGLPIALRLSLSVSGISEDDRRSATSALLDEEKGKLILKMQSCELSIMANMLLIKVYTPFLRNASTSTVATQSPPLATKSVPSPTGISVAYQTTMHAGQSIVRAAQFLQDVRTKMPGGADVASISLPTLSTIGSSSSNSHSSSTTSKILPAMFDFYPLEKVVFDAVVICAHAALMTGQGISKLSSALAFSVDDTKRAMEDVSVGLNMLSDMCAGPGRGVGEAQKQVIGALHRRFSLLPSDSGGLNLLKRKHAEIELTSPFGDVSGGYSTMANGVGGGGNGDTSLSDFDFGHNHNGHQTNPSQFQQPHTNGFLINPPATSSSTTSRSSVPPSSAHADTLASFPQDRMPRNDQAKNDLALSVTAARLSAVVARSAEREHVQDKEKEKKHAKKSHPVVGIRVRPGKDTHNSSSSRSRGQSVSGPLMTSIPRPLPSSNGSSAESVLAFQQKHKMQAMENPDAGQRAGSDSFGNQPQPEQQHRRRVGSEVEYPLPFGQPSNDTMQRKTFGVHDHGPVRQQQLSPTQAPFIPRIIDQTHTMYDQTHTQATFDGGPVQSSADVMTYNNAVSSPFSNSAGPPSSSGSPFATTSVTSSGHPPTPTFNGQRPTPPVFGPQPPAPPHVGGSPTAYFHTSNAFNEAYNSPPSSQPHQPGQNISLMDMGMDQNMVSVSENPMYDKPQQQQESMYDVKPTSMGGDHTAQHIHTLQQQQQQHISIGQAPRSYGEDMDITGQGQQIFIGMAVSTAWPGASNAQQQSQPVQGPQTSWGNESEYRFYT